MAEYRFQELATYNDEVSRGIVHTEEWKEEMKAEQSLYDSDMAERQFREFKKRRGIVKFPHLSEKEVDL